MRRKKKKKKETLSKWSERKHCVCFHVIKVNNDFRNGAPKYLVQRKPVTDAHKIHQLAAQHDGESMHRVHAFTREEKVLLRYANIAKIHCVRYF